MKNLTLIALMLGASALVGASVNAKVVSEPLVNSFLPMPEGPAPAPEPKTKGSKRSASVTPQPSELAPEPSNSQQRPPERQVSSILPTPARTKHSEPSEYDLPLDINTESGRNLATTPVHINLSIEHHNQNTVTFCAVYPYPVQPPKPRMPLRPLDSKLFNLKTLIQQTSYTRRNVRQIAYPTGGWRWQNAYNRALKRSGMMEPHLLMNMYVFSNNLLPYVYEEVKKSNEFEMRRMDRYQEALKDFKELRADAETEATRKGLDSQLLKYKKFFANGDRQATANLAAGQWWITATHKVPGLTYYWQEPVTVHEGEPSVVTLNEDNALLIEGAW